MIERIERLLEQIEEATRYYEYRTIYPATDKQLTQHSKEGWEVVHMEFVAGEGKPGLGAVLRRSGPDATCMAEKHISKTRVRWPLAAGYHTPETGTVIHGMMGDEDGFDE